MKLSRWMLLLCAPLLFVGVARFCHHQTDGFKLSKIYGNCLLSEGSVALLPADMETVLARPFTYLGRGKQSFAFLSEDKTTVLKLFNNRYQRLTFWYSLLPSFRAKSAYFQDKQHRLAASYELAGGLLQGHTGLRYLHLSPTKHLGRSVTLIDKLGIAHTLSLDETGFALQRRGTLAYSHLRDLMEAGREEEAKKALRSMVKLIVWRCKQGIADNDPLIRTNLGFQGEEPFFIDIGPFSMDPQEKERAVWVPELIKITTSLRHWLENHHPGLAPSLQEIVDDETVAN